MGQFKKMMMDLEEIQFSNVPRRLAAIDLFKNTFLRLQLNAHSCQGWCYYTNRRTNVCLLTDIVRVINDIMCQYFGDPDNEAVGWDSSSREDFDGTGFHRECGGYIVPNNRHIYTDIEELLYDQKFIVNDDNLYNDIVDAFSNIRFIQQDPYGLTDAEERMYDWRYIVEHSIKMAKEGRTLYEMTQIEKVRLFNMVMAIQVAPYPLLNERSLKLYRCVNYGKNKVPPVYFKDLTSPPVKYTKNLRMSQQGDSVFYGSLSEETARKEAIQENKEGYTYIGTFETIHPLHLLDLTKISHTLSIFNQEYDSYYLLLFLRNFCKAISKPIRNDDEQVEYVPTQLITYYFRNCLKVFNQDKSKSNIDGILYTSSKEGSPNAVLFFDNENSEKHLKLLEYKTILNGKILNPSF